MYASSFFFGLAWRKRALSDYNVVCGRPEDEFTVQIRAAREGSINYIILCERHEVEFTAEIRTIVLLCLASFFSLRLEGTYVVLKQDVLCSAPG